MAEKTIIVFNKGQRVISLSGDRQLEPGKTLELSEKEAKALLDYHDIVNVAQMSRNDNDKDVTAKLTSKLQETEAKLASLLTELESLKKSKSGGK